MSNRIVLISTAGRQEQEVEANAALSPGHLVETLSTGKVQKHSTEGGLAERHFATEDALQGRTKDDAYAADDKVMSVYALPGDVISRMSVENDQIDVGLSVGQRVDSTWSPFAASFVLLVIGRGHIERGLDFLIGFGLGLWLRLDDSNGVWADLGSVVPRFGCNEG